MARKKNIKKDVKPDVLNNKNNYGLIFDVNNDFFIHKILSPEWELKKKNVRNKKKKNNN